MKDKDMFDKAEFTLTPQGNIYGRFENAEGFSDEKGAMLRFLNGSGSVICGQPSVPADMDPGKICWDMNSLTASSATGRRDMTEVEKKTFSDLMKRMFLKTRRWISTHLDKMGSFARKALMIGAFLFTAAASFATPAEDASRDAMDKGLGMFRTDGQVFAVMKIESSELDVLRNSDRFIDAYEMGNGSSLMLFSADSEMIRKAESKGIEIHEETPKTVEQKISYRIEMGKITWATVDGKQMNDSQMKQINDIYTGLLKEIPPTLNSMEKTKARTEAANNAILRVVKDNGRTKSVPGKDSSRGL